MREIWRTLDANGMHDGVHLRVMVTRGEKSAANQDPRNALGRADHRHRGGVEAARARASSTRGISLHTSTIRCTPAEMFDMRLNSHSRLNLIARCWKPSTPARTRR